ncbi:MAG: c-type cytochrome [Pirellulaceae bacterium]
MRIGSACLLVLLMLAQEAMGQSTVPPAESLFVPEGFQAELVYEVPDEYGSWVSMTTSPDGLITCDQYGRLYRVRPGATANETAVSEINVDLGNAQGLLWAFDCLYVVAHQNNNQPAGLYRVKDSDDDGELDSAELLREFQGGGEHGPHAVILGPDAESLYVCAGNHTRLPDIQSSRVPRHWQEDNLLKRIWDPGGHAVGIMAPGGWICKTDPDGREFELVSIGFRNQYDIAMDTNGELFTYDADMEWDIGTPWYRPTRVCHVTSGSEFGWRGGDAKWPVYYPDSVPPVIDIGPGSPTGIVFGIGTDFAPEYQQALYIADWSFGFIYAVHLSPDGASWTAEKELFCSAPALQVTDMTVHDRALYFAIGGRRTRSAVYRIKASEPTSAVLIHADLTAEQRLRRELESAGAGQLDEIWDHLSHADRSVRFAARSVLERTPVAEWQEKALKETDPQIVLESLLALCRSADADASLQHRMLESIRANVDWDQLSGQQQLHLLRLCGVLVMRLTPEQGNPEMLTSLNALFAPHYPAESVNLKRELCRLLVATDDSSVVKTTMQLLEAAPTQEEQIHYVICLRLAERGWTTELRRQYLQWFVRSAVFQGGKSFAGYLRQARDEFIERLSDDEKKTLAPLIETNMVEQDPYAVLQSRTVVQDWAMDDLLPILKQADMQQRDLTNGKQVFATAQCYKCHQFAGSGGIVGPDLTGLSRRYADDYVLETLIDPHKQISDQYQATVFEMEDGRLVVGRVANLNNDDYQVQTDMIAPGELTPINRNEIMSSRPSKISPMPDDLLNTFTADDILDLLAYLRSADER